MRIRASDSVITTLKHYSCIRPRLFATPLFYYWLTYSTGFENNPTLTPHTPSVYNICSVKNTHSKYWINIYFEISLLEKHTFNIICEKNMFFGIICTHSLKNWVCKKTWKVKYCGRVLVSIVTWYFLDCVTW